MAVGSGRSQGQLVWQVNIVALRCARWFATSFMDAQTAGCCSSRNRTSVVVSCWCVGRAPPWRML